LRIGGIAILFLSHCIPWCESPIWIINEKSSYLLYAHFILVCNFSGVIILANWCWYHFGSIEYILLALANLLLVSSNIILKIEEKKKKVHADILFIFFISWLAQKLGILKSRSFVLSRWVIWIAFWYMYICLFHLYSYACYPALLAKSLYWEEILLMHPNPNQNTHAIYVHHIYLYVVFHRHSKVNCLCATFKASKIITCFV
jgi:hypothetical protein